MSVGAHVGDTMGDCELCGATNVSTREHRVNKALLAICQKCIDQLNLEPKQEAPGLARARRNLSMNTKAAQIQQKQYHEQTGKELADNFAKLIH